VYNVCFIQSLPLRVQVTNGLTVVIYSAQYFQPTPANLPNLKCTTKKIPCFLNAGYQSITKKAGSPAARF